MCVSVGVGRQCVCVFVRMVDGESKRRTREEKKGERAREREIIRMNEYDYDSRSLG